MRKLVAVVAVVSTALLLVPAAYAAKGGPRG